MKITSLLNEPAKAAFMPTVALLLTISIFFLDTVTDSEVAAAVLYVAVVLMAVRLYTPRDVVLIAIGCMALTILSYLLTPALKQTGLINTGISLVVLGLTTYLALKIESAKNVATALAEADQLRNALIGSVSHELRTPLASILGGVSILADTPAIANDHRLATLAKDVRDEALRLNNDIQNLLDAARISSQGLQSRRDWTDPADIINSAVERIQTRYPNHKIDVNLSVNLPLVHVDPVLVEQAIGQILDNAAKYSAVAPVVSLAAVAKDQQLIIAIADKGVGLTGDESRKITERFFRGRRHIGNIAGSGLGMWIADTFISSNGGKLEVASSGIGQGTTVRIFLPIPPRANDDDRASLEE